MYEQRDTSVPEITDYRDRDNWGTTKPETYIEWSIALNVL